MKLLMENWREYLNENEESLITNAAKQILKPGFMVMGHCTDAETAAHILKTGFKTGRERLNLTFLSVDAKTIHDQLKDWPYGECTTSGMNPQAAQAVVFIRTPERVSPDEWNRVMLDIKRSHGAIPGNFFVGMWIEHEAKFIPNPTYNEDEILKLFRDVEREKIPEPEPIPPQVQVSKANDSGDDVW